MAAIGTRLLKIEIDGTEYTTESTSAKVVTAEGDTDFVTFAVAASGGATEFRLEFTAAQDLATGSLWRAMWDGRGDTVPFTLMPYGNATPSAGEPHVEGMATIKLPDGDLVGGEADASTSARWTVECSWVCDGEPELVTA